MTAAEQRLANAIDSMSEDQRWALRVTIAIERRLRTHFTGNDRGDTAMELAKEYALENVK